jgi:hypothetical protein
MASYGPLSKCEPLHEQLQAALGCGKAILIEFPTFDPNRDVMNVSIVLMSYALEPSADQTFARPSATTPSTASCPTT